MISTICTLFEKEYHFGVGALTNSLYRQGYRGEIFAGYRGALPHWTASAKENNTLNWVGARTLMVAEGLQLHFIPLETEYHLTNYKPDFMLSLINGPAKSADAIFYFDPDIVQAAPWSFMEEWVNSGVALSEDFNSPLDESHPKRVYWRKYFKNFGQELKFKNPVYVNGGFVGVSKINFPFLNLWQQVQENMAHEIGGLNMAIFNKGTKIPSGKLNGFYPFGKTDQDALNATVECYEGKCSFLGKEAMNFGPGQSIMPHAIGHKKPWNKKNA